MKIENKQKSNLWKTAQECVRDSKTILRPLVYEWPNDPNVLDCADEYLLGEDILVAPLLKEKAERRSVYLPSGTWYGFFDGIEYQGE